MISICVKKLLLTGLALVCCIFATARQRIFIDTLAESPFPLAWNTIDNYNPNGKPYYVVLLRNKAYAYADKNKFLKQLPFELPKPRNFFYYSGTPTWHKVKNGYLVGYDHGEWGGGLYWFSANGSENYKISGEQVQQFIIRKKELFALTEGSNQGMPLGRIIRLVFENGKWVSQPYLSINTHSHSVTVKGDDLFVLAHAGIFKIDKQKNIHPLLDKPIWQGTHIYNTSVIVCRNVLYAGMWEGVYKYHLESGKQEWFSLKAR